MTTTTIKRLAKAAVEPLDAWHDCEGRGCFECAEEAASVAYDIERGR